MAVGKTAADGAGSAECCLTRVRFRTGQDGRLVTFCFGILG